MTRKRKRTHSLLFLRDSGQLCVSVYFQFQRSTRRFSYDEPFSHQKVVDGTLKHSKILTEFRRRSLTLEEKKPNLPIQSRYGAGQGCNRVGIHSIRGRLYDTIDLLLHHMIIDSFYLEESPSKTRYLRNNSI